uniref:Putative secreted protein n=1 Tax=Anopheles marajoara TaxID=58244 RepID=A0A2M4CF69_9DIPT
MLQRARFWKGCICISPSFSLVLGQQDFLASQQAARTSECFSSKKTKTDSSSPGSGCKRDGKLFNPLP